MQEKYIYCQKRKDFERREKYFQKEKKRKIFSKEKKRNIFIGVEMKSFKRLWFKT